MKQNVPVPFQNFLVLAQLTLVGYLLEFWVLNKPDDSKNMTGPRLLWDNWMIFEVLTTASTLPNCIVYLLFRASGIILYDERMLSDDKDIIEQQMSIIHGYSAYFCVTIQFLFISIWMKSINVDSELITYMSVLACCWSWGWISQSIMLSTTNRFRKRGSIEPYQLRLKTLGQVSMMIVFGSAIPISIMILVRDENMILTPFAIEGILVGIFGVLANIWGFRRDHSGVSEVRRLSIE